MIAIALMLVMFANASTKHADRLFDKWEYYKAAQLYEKESEKNPTQYVYYRLGQCYQKMHRYNEAVVAYDKVNSMGTFNDASFYLNYGLVLKSNRRYTEAETAFATYTSMMPSDKAGEFYKSSCDTIIKDANYDLPIKVVTIGSLNSNASDLCPMLYKGGLVFISSRKVEGHGSKIYSWDGEYYLDILYAKQGNGDTNFVSLTPLGGNLNKEYHNGPVTFSKNYDTVYFNRVSKELKGKEKRTLNIERNKIYSAVYKDGAWTDLKPFPYNNDTFSVATPCLANNGSRIYFSSDMPGGYGGDDLYYCDKTPDGSWGRPVNMGPQINTFGDEKFPSIDSAGNLYFSSNGYKGFGGMDICVSKNVNGTFSQASVLKEPFNSAGDDYGITFIRNGKTGYFSSNRNGGKGDEDIYYFNMNKDSLPCDVSTSDYVIGFKCPPKEVVMDTVHKDSVYHFAEAPNRFTEEKEMTRIHFDFDKYTIRTDAAEILDSVVSVMNKYPDLVISVNGYCDSRGSYAYNQVLSDHRSDAAVNYLASKGISKDRMKPKGYGKTAYLNRCTDGVVCSDFEHAENRRVEILYTPEKGMTSVVKEHRP